MDAADLELIEKVRQSLAAPVSAAESASKRRSLLLNAVPLSLAMVAAHGWRQARGANSVSDIVFVSIAVGLPLLPHLRTLAREYSLCRPRPSFPVPDDILDAAVGRSQLCPRCRALAKKADSVCPGCGGDLPGEVRPVVFWGVVAVGVVLLTTMCYMILR